MIKTISDADQALLLAAAKAAGLDVVIMALSGPNIVSGPGAGKLWNPLTSDADAFRLMVKLRMTVDVRKSRTTVFHPDPTRTALTKLHKNSPYNATRVAIVRAAAGGIQK